MNISSSVGESAFQMTNKGQITVVSGSNNTFTGPVHGILSNTTGELQSPNRNHWTSLIDKYKQVDSWMRPLPWESSPSFAPEDYYVELDLDINDRTGKHIRTEKVDLQCLFDPAPGSAASPVRILVRGNAGFGKSTLCAKSIYDWANKIGTFKNLDWKTTLPVLIKLRTLTLGKPDSQNLERVEEHPKNITKDVQEVSRDNLQKEIFECIQEVYTKETESPDLLTVLKRLGRNLLLILDGYDELDQQGQNSVKALLSWESSNPTFKNASFLVTSRPTQDGKFLKLFDKHFTIRQMGEDKIEQLVTAFERNSSACPYSARSATTINDANRTCTLYPNTKKIENIVQNCTNKETRLIGLSPLMVSLICWITKQPDFSYDMIDPLYDCVVHLCWRCNEREGFGLSKEDIFNALWRFGALLLRYDILTFIPSVYLIVELGEKLTDFFSMIGIMKYEESKIGFEAVHRSFFDSLAERIIDNKQSGSLSLGEAKQVIHKLHFHHHSYIGTKGILKSMSLTGSLQPYLLLYNHQLDKVAVIKQEHVKSSPIYSIRFTLSVIEFPLSPFRRCISQWLHTRIEELVSIGSGSQRSLRFDFLEDNEKVFVELLRNYAPDIQNNKWSEIRLSAERCDKLKVICSKAVKTLFSFPNENRPENESPINFFRELIRYIQQKHKGRYVTVTEWFKDNAKFAPLKFFALSSELFAKLVPQETYKIINLNWVVDRQWSMSTDDYTFASQFTWADLHGVDVDTHSNTLLN